LYFCSIYFKVDNSAYTIFLVLFSCGRRTYWFYPHNLISITLQFTSCRKSIPTCLNVFPCTLLVVTAYDNLTGNCIILKLKCKSLGIIGMRVISTVSVRLTHCWASKNYSNDHIVTKKLKFNFPCYLYYYYKAEEFVKAYRINNNNHYYQN